MATKKLFEHGALVESKTANGTWPIRIITEGKGSSGVYSRELLEEYKDVFANRPMFGNHPTDPNKPHQRSPFEMKAKLGPVVEYREVDGVAGLYGEAIVDEEVDKFLDKFAEQVAVSIFATGDGHEENGEYIVESFDGSDPYTSVDFVVAAGRGGGVERVVEAYRALEQNGSAPAGRTNENKEQTSMEIEELAAKVDALVESFTALASVLTPLAESLKPEEVPEVDVAAAVESAIDKAAEADLPKELRAHVIEAAKAGGDVDAALAEQKAIVDAVKASIKTNDHFVEGVFGGGNADDDDFAVSSVRFN